MSRATKEREGKRTNVKRPRVPKSPRDLDRLAKEAIDNFASIIARCGYPTAKVVERLRLKGERLSKSLLVNTRQESKRRYTESQPGAPKHLEATNRSLSAHDIYSHALTWWWTDPDYCVDGVPRALPERGPAPSIEALHLRLGRQASHEAGMDYLVGTKSIRQVGSHFIPVARLVSHRGTESQDGHHMRALAGFLRTIARNKGLPSGEKTWYQYVADNAMIPASKRQAVHEDLQKAATPFLIAQDTNMMRYERARERDEATIPMMVGVWISEGPRVKAKERRSGLRKRNRRQH